MATPIAAILPPGKTIFFNALGAPLAGGTVGTYIPGTLTQKLTWQDPLEATPNSNPIVLDSSGGCLLYGSGQYRTIVSDSLGNLIYDALTQDSISLASAANAGAVYGGTSTGSANVQALSISSISALTAGQQISFIAGYSNTSSATLNISSIGAKNIYKQTIAGPAALTGNEIVAGQLVIVSYDGTEFQILGSVSNFASLNQVQNFTAAQRGTPVTLSYATTITPDLNTGNFFAVTLTGNTTFANPANQTNAAGQPGVIVITQDSSGSHTASWGSNWKFSGGSAPILTSRGSAVDILSFYVESSARISASLLANTD